MGVLYEPEPNSGCWLWLKGMNPAGYGCLEIEGYPHRAHRMMYVLAYGQIPDGLCVLHKCDTPGCVNPAHLFVGTRADNNNDKANKGRCPNGESHYHTHLTKKNVSEIKRHLMLGETQKTIAARFRINRSSVSKIKRGVRWARYE